MANKMTYHDLMLEANSIFNFHPDSRYENVASILQQANKCLPLVPRRLAILMFADHMAKYIDNQRENKDE